MVLVHLWVSCPGRNYHHHLGCLCSCNFVALNELLRIGKWVLRDISHMDWMSLLESRAPCLSLQSTTKMNFLIMGYLGFLPVLLTHHHNLNMLHAILLVFHSDQIWARFLNSLLDFQRFCTFFFLFLSFEAIAYCAIEITYTSWFNFVVD